MFFLLWNSKPFQILQDEIVACESNFKHVFHPFLLAKQMFCISSSNKYSHSLNSLESFCIKAFKEQQKNYFSAIVFYQKQLELIAYLNVNVNDNEIEIDYLAVKENFRRQGIAESLLFYLDKSIKLISDFKINRIMLEVGKNNLEAISLYKKNGFCFFYQRKNYYNNAEDALLLERVL